MSINSGCDLNLCLESESCQNNEFAKTGLLVTGGRICEVEMLKRTTLDPVLGGQV